MGPLKAEAAGIRMGARQSQGVCTLRLKMRSVSMTVLALGTIGNTTTKIPPSAN
jgi:hypothetical protein